VVTEQIANLSARKGRLGSSPSLSAMKKVSFDFDKTLDVEEVQSYAKDLMDKGIDVYITTSRYTDDLTKRKGKNEDLYKVANLLGIKKSNIIFTNMAFKSEILKNYNFIWHLDDKPEEVALINSTTKTKGVLLNRIYKSICNNLLNIK
jgi:hypothetical protein